MRNPGQDDFGVAKTLALAKTTLARAASELQAQVARELQAKTTLAMRNLGHRVTRGGIFEELERTGLQAYVDFAHVALDYRTKCCVGLAFVNFTLLAHADAARLRWTGSVSFAGDLCQGNRGLNVVWAKKQGFSSCVLEDLKHNTLRRDVMMKPWVRPDKDAYRNLLASLEKLVRLRPLPVGPVAPGRVHSEGAVDPDNVEDLVNTRDLSELAQPAGLLQSCVSVPRPEDEVDEQLWIQRHRKRHFFIDKVRSSDLYRACSAAGVNLPTEPDPDDRAISKRAWDAAMATWRRRLRSLTEIEEE